MRRRPTAASPRVRPSPIAMATSKRSSTALVPRPDRAAGASGLLSRLPVLRSSQQFDKRRNTPPREVLVEGDQPVAFGATGIVLDDTVRKVAALRQHLQADLTGGAVDLDVARLNDASNDIDDVCAGIAVHTFQYPHEFTE